VVVFSLHGDLCSKAIHNSAKSTSEHVPSHIKTQKVFGTLLRHFNVGIWSSVFPSRLDEAVQHLLPFEIILQLLFVHGCDKSHRPYSFHYFQALIRKRSMDPRTRKYLNPTIVVVVDIDPFRNTRKSKVHYLRKSNPKMQCVVQHRRVNEFIDRKPVLGLNFLGLTRLVVSISVQMCRNECHL
jgi:hypothetical protein